MTLLQLLKEKNITQTEFASKLNVTQSTVSKWCRGTCSPKFTELCKMIKILDVDFDVIVMCFEKSLNNRGDNGNKRR